ncbi:MAG: hypothetical protein H6671_15070 [Anaerolineaceae bacterium]|nr:hypothetical protein [Anaerolineaceae bacterium]
MSDYVRTDGLNSQGNKQNIFVLLLIGLSYNLEHSLSGAVSPTLRHALNHLAIEMQAEFPKTLTTFFKKCEEPVDSWFPYPIPPEFNPQSSLLYDGTLSEEAQEYCFYITERIGVSTRQQHNLPQSALDNLLILDTLDRLRHEDDRSAAQKYYVSLRSFLISHSWITGRHVRETDFDYALQEEIVKFYEESPVQAGDDVYTCDYCGILQFRDGRLYGIKPDYCYDHPINAPHVHRERAPHNLRRLRVGIHLRTFLPGQAELRLFDWADDLRADYPDFIDEPERYPGLDACDLCLTFSDGEIWGIDVKDHKSPHSLTPHIQPIYGEYTHTFYVIPDRRIEANSEYMEVLKGKVGHLPGNLQVEGETDFRYRVETKLEQLRKKATRSRKQQKGNF